LQQTQSIENSKYLCKDCNASKTLKLKVRHTEEQKELILKTYLERWNMRGVQHLFGISKPTLTARIKSPKFKELKEILAKRSLDDVLELDGVWSYVGKREKCLALDCFM
jgi:transposase-like protein